MGLFVYEEEIGDSVETGQRLALIDADRLIGEVPAGGNNGDSKFLQEQMMEWGVGEHDSEIGIIRGYRRRDGGSLGIRIPPSPEKNDGEIPVPRADVPRAEIHHNRL